MADRVTILDAIDDPALFGPSFKRREHWRAWRAFLAALFGLPMSPEERELFTRHTARESLPSAQAREAWLVVGRRGGKSFIVALIACYLAAFRDYRPFLARGERGVVMVLAADRKQARVIFRYVLALSQGVPMLAKLIVAERAESIELANSIDIEIHTASFRAVRGYTVVAALCDEIAFWPADESSANPDTEIVNALRPAMATIPTSLLVGLSSPYARRGVLWEQYRDHFGHAGNDTLVWQAESRAMNPTLDSRVVDAAYADDPTAAAAEYGAQFRSDVSAFLSDEWIDRATNHSAIELPPVAGARYHAFADPSGGGADAFTLAIAHRDGVNSIVLDALRGRRPPFNPEQVVADYAAVLKSYGLARVTGDRYAGEWVASAFRKHGISYEPSEKAKSDLYLEAEPLFARGAARILDQRPLLLELRQLERRTAPSGKDRVDHPPRGHDDFANAACGALWLAARQRATANLDTAQFITLEDAREERAAAFAERCGGSTPWD
jgi:hypothetical protein